LKLAPQHKKERQEITHFPVGSIAWITSFAAYFIYILSLVDITFSINVEHFSNFESSMMLCSAFFQALTHIIQALINPHASSFHALLFLTACANNHVGFSTSQRIFKLNVNMPFLQIKLLSCCDVPNILPPTAWQYVDTTQTGKTSLSSE